MVLMEDLLFELLQTNECVVIPGFGGFIAKPKGAKIDFDSGTINPPFKEIGFNIMLQHDDHFFASKYSLRNQLDEIKGYEQIQGIVQNWNQTLKTGKRLNIPKIGTLWQDQEGNTQFEQDRSFNLLLGAYGMGSIQFVPSNSERKRTSPSRKKTAYWKYAAAAAIAIPIAFYSVWIPVKTPVIESGMISVKDFNPFGPTSKSSYQQKSFHFNSLEKINDDKSFTKEFDAFEASKNNLDFNQPVSEVTPNLMYCIAGCFSNKENADHLCAKLKGLGFDALLLKEGNLYKVSLGSGISEEAIQMIANRAEANHINYWILK